MQSIQHLNIQIFNELVHTYTKQQAMPFNQHRCSQLGPILAEHAFARSRSTSHRTVRRLAALEPAAATAPGQPTALPKFAVAGGAASLRSEEVAPHEDGRRKDAVTCRSTR